MRRIVLAWAVCVPLVAAAATPTVRIEPPQLGGSRPIEPSTQAEAVRDYLHAWDSLNTALDGNQTAALDPDFVGAARDRLAETIGEQSRLGIHAGYQALSHDIQFVFYSTEGQSLELLDTVEYEQQVFLEGKPVAREHIRSRWYVVLTPAEVRWRVRIFQAQPLP